MSSSSVSTPSTTKPDYWGLALKSLQPDLQSSIKSANTGKHDVLAAVLKTAEEKRDICLKKRWNLTKSNGEVIILRDVVEKIAKWIHKFKEIGDIAVQYDPAHASLPWAGIRFLLLAAVNDVEILGTMTEDLETISRLIASYKAFEVLYMSCQPVLVHGLEDSLTKLYAEILIFLAQAIKYYRDSTIVRSTKGLFRTADNSRMQKIHKQEAEVLKLADLKDAEALFDVRTVVSRLSDRVRVFERALEEQQHLELLRWISPIDFNSIHRDISHKRLAGSGQWLLSHTQYEQWRNSSSSSILLIHGIPGCGKTLLSSVVVDSFLAERQSNPTMSPFAYFYCARYETERERSRPEDILRSIVRQLTLSGSSKPKARHVLLAEYDRRKAQCKVEGTNMSNLQIEDSERLILDVTTDDPVTFVIDAIDEVDDDQRFMLLDALSRVVANSQNVVKVLLTSRDQEGSYASLTKASRLRIQSQDTHEDMKRFIRHLMDGNPGHGKLLKNQTSPDLENSLTNTILEEAGEMFLWVEFQFRRYRRFHDEQEVIDAIQAHKFGTMDHIYKDTVDELLNTGSKLAIKTVSWLLYAQEPLSPGGFISAVSNTTIVPTSVAEQCLNLVVYDDNSTRFRFAHQSVREFVRKLPIFSPSSSHRLLATTCINKCLAGVVDSNSPLDPLHRYSVMYWPYHYRLSDLKDTTSELFHRMIRFMYDEDGDVSLYFQCWLELTKQISRGLDRGHLQKLALDAIESIDPTPLFTSCAFGLNDLLDHIAAKTPGHASWEQKNLHGQTGLYLAAAMGHYDIVKRLIQQGADCNVECKRRGFPLAAACFNGHMGVAVLLVDAGASLNPTINYPNALEAAMDGGHESIAIYLLETVCQPLDQSTYDMAVLRASHGGYLKVLTWLQKSDVLTKFGKRAPNTMALRNKMIRGGHVAMLRKSIENTIDPLSALPADGLSTAALHGQIAMVNFLLDSRVDVESEGQLGTPLRTACLMNHVHIAHNLLKHGANIDSTGVMGSALQAAAMRGHIQLVQILIDKGADVNSGGGLLGNPLQAAAYYGHRETVERLLNAGADAYQLGFTRDAFHAAAEGGHEDVVNFLRQKHYYPHYPGSTFYFSPSLENFKPLRASWDNKDPCGPDFEAIHRLTLEPGPVVGKEPERNVSEVYINQALSQDPYPIMSGVWSGQASIVRILLQEENRHGAAERDAAFVQAAKAGLTEIVRLFLAEVGPSSWSVEKALESAASSGCLDTVQILLDFETPDTPQQGHIVSLLSSGHLALVQHGLSIANEDCSSRALTDLRKRALEAITAGNVQSDDTIQTIEILINTQPSLDPETDLESCLRLSAAWGHVDIVAHLVHQHLRMAEYTMFQVPLLLAAGNGHLEIIQILYEKMQEKELGLFYSQALAVSSEAGHLSVVKFLIHIGADVNALVPQVPVFCRYRPYSFCSGWEFGHSYCCHDGGSAVTDYTFRCEEESESGPNYIYGRGVETPTLISILQACLRGFEHPDYDCSAPRSGRSTKHRWAWIKGTQHEKVLEFLLRHGADPNYLGGREYLPIIYAATYCTLENLRSLIEGGACVGATNNNKSVLHGAIIRTTSTQAVFDFLSGLGATLPTKSAPGAMDPVLEEVLDQTYRIGVERRFHPPTTDVFQGGIGSVLKGLLMELEEEKAHDDRYKQVLIMAAQLNEYSVVELLLERDVDVNASVDRYGTALQTASSHGHLDIVCSLLEAGANVNTLSGEHGTALRAAIAGAHPDTVKLLLSWRADITLKGSPGGSSRYDFSRTIHSPSALQLAVQSRCLASVKLLIDAGADARELVEGRDHPLWEACEIGDIQMIEALLHAGAPVDPPAKPYADSTLLGIACRKGCLDIVHCLINHGACINNGSEHPVVIAAKYGQLHVVRYFLTLPDIESAVLNEALETASSKGHSTVVNELVLHVDFPEVWRHS